MDDKEFKKALLIQLGILTAVLVAGLMIVFYFKNNIKQTAQAIKNTQQLINTKSKNLETLAYLRKDYNDFGMAYLNVLHNVLPKRDELFDVSQQLQDLAQTIKLGFGFSFVNEQAPNPPNPGFIQFRLNLNGDINQVSTYLKRLTQLHYFSSIDAITFQNNSASVSGKLYFRE